MAFSYSVAPTAGVGTISIAKGSTTVTGVGTNFTSPALGNRLIIVNGFTARVLNVANATTMTINRFPSYAITSETFQHNANFNILATGTETSLAGLAALDGVNVTQSGTQLVYDLGVQKLIVSGAGSSLSWNALTECFGFAPEVVEPELTINVGTTASATGVRTDGTFTAPFYPRALGMPRVGTVAGTQFNPIFRSIVQNGTFILDGVWIDGNVVTEMTSGTTITNCKWTNTNQAANFRTNSTNININGLALHRANLTLTIDTPDTLNGIEFYDSHYVPNSLPAVAPANPRIYTDWNFLGTTPFMNNFSGNANYVEFVNLGDWDGFRLASNANVQMAIRLVKALSLSVIDSSSVGVDNAIIYRLDTNNGNRGTFYTADEHLILTTASGTASGKVLAQVGRLPAGAVFNSTIYTAVMDFRNAANNATGNDILRYASYDHLLSSRAINTKGTGTLEVEQTLFDDPNVTLDRLSALALIDTKFSFNPTLKKITVLINATGSELYDASKAYKTINNAVNLATPTLDTTIASINGFLLSIFPDWDVEIATGATLSPDNKIKEVKLNGDGLLTGTITMPFSDALGSRISIAGLDPQNFGVTWNVRYKEIGTEDWTELTGTGNITIILADLAEYKLQARVAGYTWKEVEFNANNTLSIDLDLQYHTADDGSPQYLKPFNQSLVDIFEYDDVTMEVEVTNTTGAILQPGFPELYQVIEKVQQDPTLVWLWVNPVTTNSTSQKVLIPPTSPLRLFLSEDSDASVKITCPVVYSDTGVSADDRVKGNPAGFSIILGSAATADSSLIVAQLIEQLGGDGYVKEQHALVKIKTKVNKGLTKTQYLGLS
jgi:hypothetical protein